MRLNAVRLFVRDLDRARFFYEQLLGLPWLGGDAAQGYCRFGSDGLELIVEHVAEDAPAADQALVGRFSGVSFTVTDIHDEHARLEEIGVHFSGGPEQQAWGGWLATFVDPSGNELQIAQSATGDDLGASDALSQGSADEPADDATQTGRAPSQMPAAGYILRAIQRSDYNDLWRVRYAVHENTLRPGVLNDDDMRRETEDSGRGWLVEDESGVAAFAIGNAQTGNIWALFVHPDAERRGYARALYNTMVPWLWTQGLTQLNLSTAPGTRAAGFYSRRGWRSSGRAANGDLLLELPRPEAPATAPAQEA